MDSMLLRREGLFPCISKDMLISQGLEIYGLSNWSKVAEHVGTKSKSQCIDHYNMMYMNSPCFPLPVCHIFST